MKKINFLNTFILIPALLFFLILLLVKIEYKVLFFIPLALSLIVPLGYLRKIHFFEAVQSRTLIVLTIAWILVLLAFFLAVFVGYNGWFGNPSLMVPACVALVFLGANLTYLIVHIKTDLKQKKYADLLGRFMALILLLLVLFFTWKELVLTFFLILIMLT